MFWNFYEPRNDDSIFDDSIFDDYNELVPVDDDEPPPEPRFTIFCTGTRMHPDMELSEWRDLNFDREGGHRLRTTIRMCCTEENADAFVPEEYVWEFGLEEVQEKILQAVAASSNWRERGEIRMFVPLREECRKLLLETTGIHLSFDMWAFMLDENVVAAVGANPMQQQDISSGNPFAALMQEEEEEEITDDNDDGQEVVIIIEKKKKKRKARRS